MIYAGTILILLAAIFKAVADTVAHHYDTSIFRWNDFYNPLKQGKKIPFTKYPLDGWHLANSLMIVSFICAWAFHKPILKWYYEIPIAGVAFNLTFNLFYNKILR